MGLRKCPFLLELPYSRIISFISANLTAFLGGNSVLMVFTFFVCKNEKPGIIAVNGIIIGLMLLPHMVIEDNCDP